MDSRKIAFRPRRSLASVGRVSSWALTLFVVSCDRGTVTDGAAAEQRVSAYVVGHAADALDSRGHFVLAPRQLGSTPEVTEAQAVALATIYLRTYGRSLEGEYTAQHGSRVEVAKLVPCGPAYYAAAAYPSIPNTATSEARKLLGPKWLMQMCGSDGPAVIVSVSSLATDLRNVGGHLRPQPRGDFAVRGIPKAMGFGLIAPEDAVIDAAQKTGRRVSEPPELVLAPYPYSPFVPKWKITLDGPARTKGQHSHQVSESTVLFAGFGGAWSVKGLQAAEPGGQSRYLTLRDRDHGRPVSEIPLLLRADLPAKYELLEVVR